MLRRACSPNRGARWTSCAWTARRSRNWRRKRPGCSTGTNPSGCLRRDVPVADGYAVIVDAVYGIGFHGALSDRAAAVMDRVNRGRAHRVALDLPSGAECDACRADPLTFRADDTLTFICRKPVQLHAPSDGFCGRVAR